MPVRLSA